MKIAKKIGIITIIYLALNTLNVSAAGSASISASANYVEEGSKVTFYISLKNVAGFYREELRTWFFVSKSAAFFIALYELLKSLFAG